MPVRPGDELRKVTLNLYEADCAKLESAVGYGWTGRVREVINEYCQTIRIVKLTRRPTLGDLADD